MSLIVTEVKKKSPAAKMGWGKGDRILAVDRCVAADEMDFQFLLACSDGTPWVHWQTVQGVKKSRKLPLPEGEDLGVRFQDFKVKTCRNNCLFCFVRQLPRGVRPELRIRDDDFRLSFLHGNYLSLTNLTEEDVHRIIQQRISPLYVSVHSTRAAIRAKLLGRPAEFCRLGLLWRLVRAGIEIHTQIVLCPGINDGPELPRTLKRLFRCYPGIAGVAVVPVGLTEHRRHLPELRPVTRQGARDVLETIGRLQQEFLAVSGSRFVFPADEFFLLAGQSVPPASYYEGFQQLEDGIGMLASFRQDFNRLLPSWKGQGIPPPDGTLVTGKLFAPFLTRYAHRLQRQLGGRLRVIAVENGFLGAGVTVAGLLSGGDILQALQGRDVGKWVMVPGESLSQDRSLFLDDRTLQDLERQMTVPFGQTKRTVEGFLESLRDLTLRTQRRPARRNS